MTLTKVQVIDNKIVALKQQIEKLEGQKAAAAFEDKLIVGATVAYKSSRSSDAGTARIIAMQANEEGKDVRYTVRINEGTADETTRKLRLAEITEVVSEAPSQDGEQPDADI